MSAADHIPAERNLEACGWGPTDTTHRSSILCTADDYRGAAREAFHEDLARIAT